MTSVLPHSAVIRKNVDDYLDLTSKHINGRTHKLKSTAYFRTIYKITLALDSVLAKLSRRLTPKPSVLRLVVQQIPVLVAVTDESASQVQLRRFIECVFWQVYFSEHKVEWEEFSSNPGLPIQRDLTKPIAYSAHRESSFYRNYAKERFATEPSGLARGAIDALSTDFATLSAAAHGSSAVRSGKLYPPLVSIDDARLSGFADCYRRVASSGAIILCAFSKLDFDALPPAYRSWFDWLVGSNTSKLVRSGHFGL